MKILTYLLYAVIIVALIYVFSLFQEFSYFSLSKNYTEIGTLLKNPLNYNNGSVCTAGKYGKGGGVSELVDVQKPTGTIWIEGPVEQSVFTSLWQNYISQSTYKTGIARVCGTFQLAPAQGRGFGDNGQYQYQITTNH